MSVKFFLIFSSNPSPVQIEIIIIAILEAIAIMHSLLIDLEYFFLEFLLSSLFAMCFSIFNLFFY